MKNIECAIEDTVPADGTADSLRIEGFGNRIRINVQNIKPDEDDLAFDLLIGYQLAYEYGAGIKNVINAMVLSLEQPEAGAAGVLRLGDPDVRPVSPNFSGEPPGEESAAAFFGGICGLRIATSIALLEPSPIYLRVCLQHIVSNCVVVRPIPKSSSTYEEK